MKTKVLYFCLILGMAINMPQHIIAQSDIHTETQESLRHSIDVSPISPFIGIYGIQYSYEFLPKNEFITGLAYMNIEFDFGATHSPALILGYRRYLWKNLHIEYQIWPCYDDFYETNEQKYYSGFDVWNEFRLGYRFDFKIKRQNLYTSFQWPFGFGLYAGNKPESFLEHEKENRFFYQFPLLFVGIRF